MAKIQYPYYKRQRPSTSISVDSSALGNVAGDSQKNLVLVGSSQGGQPGILYQLTSLTQARSIFKGGELLDAIEMAWTPSDEQAGAGTIYAIRADQATQARKVLDNLVITSQQYGDATNKITVELTDNAITNTKRLRVRDLDTNSVEVFDNLGSIFTVKYAGTEALATATVAGKKLTIEVGATEGSLAKVLEYDLTSSSYEYISAIITDISSYEDFEASFVPYGDKNILSAELDDVAGVDIKGENGHVFTGLIGDLLNQTSYSQFIVIERKEDATGSTVENFAPVALEGGSNGDVPASWANMLQVIASDDAPLSYYLVPLSPLASVHAEVATFVTEQTNLGYPMRAIVGGTAGETYAQTISRQKALYNSRASLVGFDAVVRMGDGRVVTQPAYMLASLVAGLASGLPVGEPITYKNIRVASLARSYNAEQLDQLHLNGIIACEKVRNLSASSTFRIVSDVTTLNNDRDPVKSEMSLGEETDFLVMELKEELDSQFMGVRTLSTSALNIRVAIESFLQRKKISGQVADYDSSNVSVVIIGNRAEISFVVSPARGLSYINANMIYESTTFTSDENN